MKQVICIVDDYVFFTYNKFYDVYDENNEGYTVISEFTLIQGLKFATVNKKDFVTLEEYKEKLIKERFSQNERRIIQV